MTLRSPAALLAVLALLVLGTRLGVAGGVSDTFFSTGQQIYDEVAENLLDGEGFTQAGRPTAENPPLYPLGVAAAYAIGGRGWWSVAVLQALFDVASLLLLYLLARRLFGRTAALLAAAMFALYPYLAAQSALLMDTSMFVLALLAFLYLLTRWADSGRLRDAALAGIAGGAALLVRPTILIFLLATPFLLWLLGRRWKGMLPALGVAVACFALVQVPWTVRNAVRFDAFVLGSAKTGENFYGGNSPHAAEYISRGLSTDLLRTRPDAPKPPADLDQVERDRWWLDRGLEWVRDNPGDWAHVLRVKLEALWSWELNPKTAGDTRLKQVLYTATYAPLLVLSLLSLVRGLFDRARRRELAFVAVLIGLWTLVHVLVVGYTRVRTPLDPLLMALAGSLLADATAVALRERRESSAPLRDSRA